MKHIGKWSKFLTISLAFFIVIAIAAVAYGAGGGEGAHHGGDFTPARLKDLLWRVLNFAVLVVILVKFLAVIHHHNFLGLFLAKGCAVRACGR